MTDNMLQTSNALDKLDNIEGFKLSSHNTSGDCLMWQNLLRFNFFYFFKKRKWVITSTNHKMNTIIRQRSQLVSVIWYYVKFEIFLPIILRRRLYTHLYYLRTTFQWFVYRTEITVLTNSYLSKCHVNLYIRHIE